MPYLSAELENGQTDWDDEWEERQLKSVECFNAQNAKTQWHKSDDFQEDKSQDWNSDLLQFWFTWFDWGSVEFNFEVNFVIFQIASGNGDFAIGYWQIQWNIVALNVIWKCIQNVGGWTSLSHSLSQWKMGKWENVERENCEFHWKFVKERKSSTHRTGDRTASQNSEYGWSKDNWSGNHVVSKLIALCVCDVALPDVN